MKIVEPGIIKTNFAGRSFDFSNDEALTEYQELVGKLMGSLENLYKVGSEPLVVAKVIYEAATDGTNKLRYTAGDDARQLMDNRKKLEDEELYQLFRSQLGI